MKGALFPSPPKCQWVFHLSISRDGNQSLLLSTTKQNSAQRAIISVLPTFQRQTLEVFLPPTPKKYTQQKQQQNKNKTTTTKQKNRSTGRKWPNFPSKMWTREERSADLYRCFAARLASLSPGRYLLTVWSALKSQEGEACGGSS